MTYWLSSVPGMSNIGYSLLTEHLPPTIHIHGLNTGLPHQIKLLCSNLT